MLMAAFSVLLWSRLTSSPAAPSTAILAIQPAVFLTSTSTGSALPSPNSLEATPVITPGGELVIGAYVQVAGTGGDGLRLRDQPGLNGKILLVASEAEVFEVDDGPIEMDGYTWWHLKGPFDPARQGWAVASFLGIVQKP